MWYDLLSVILYIILYFVSFFKCFKKESDFLPLAGIIAEFNPLHSGHKHLIETAKKDRFDVACVISGNFVQRGDTAIIPKFNRAEAALRVGADVVVELPVPWSMSTAQNFAFGGVSQLSALGIDALYFGSECGNLKELTDVSEILLSKEYDSLIKEALGSGETFAKIRSKTVSKLLGRKSSVLEYPNDTLAVEYISAAKKLGLMIEFRPVKRVGAGHDEAENDGYTSASLLRRAIRSSDYDYAERYMPQPALDILRVSPISDSSNIDTSVLAVLKRLKQSDFSLLPDMSEGLDRLLYKTVRESSSVTELVDKVKSKRYTMARIRRLIYSAFLGIDNEFFLKEPPYLRMLGFTENGKKYLSTVSSKPLVTKVSQISKLDDFSKKVFETENLANEMYTLSLNVPKAFVSEQSEAIRKVLNRRL